MAQRIVTSGRRGSRSFVGVLSLLPGPAQRCDLVCVDEWQVCNGLQYCSHECGFTRAIRARKDMQDG